MDQDSQSQTSQKIGQLQGVLLVGVVLNIIWVFVLFWFALSDPKLPIEIPVDRTVLKLIAVFLVGWLSIGILQGLGLVMRTHKAKEAFLKGSARDGVLLGHSWSPFPIAMPVCIVSDSSNSKDGNEKYFAVMPLDRNKFVQRLVNPKSLANDSAEIQVFSDPGTRQPLCIVGKDQAFVVCWSVPKWSSIRKING